MSQQTTDTIDINGHACRVWRKGSGPKVGVFAGYGGLPRWTPFLDRLAETRTVVVPSLPGYPGATGHTLLDTHLDWVLAARMAFVKAGLEGSDLVGSSVGGSFAAEVAALWPASVRKLVLIAPFGLFDENEPATDPWAQKAADIPGLMCADGKIYENLKAMPEGANSIEWPIEQTRAAEAAARAFWPLGNTKIEKRLPLITAPTLLLWGAQDRIMPRRYADTMRGLIPGAQLQTIAAAGHLAELDQPDATAAAILAFLE